MSKVTSKLQVTVPKALAREYGIAPGDDIRFEASGEVIRVVPPNADAPAGPLGIERRLALFDAASARQCPRQCQCSRASGNTRLDARGLVPAWRPAGCFDTNVLVYRYDGRFPDMQSIAEDVLRDGIADGSGRVAHQALVEFVAAVTRGAPERWLLEPSEARRSGGTHGPVPGAPSRRQRVADRSSGRGRLRAVLV